MKKIVTLLTSLLLITGCVNNASSSVVVIDKDDKVLEEFYQTPEYISSKSKLIDSTSSNIGMSFASYEEKEEFNNQLKAKKNADSEDYTGMIEYLDNIGESRFENFNLIFTSDMSLMNSSFSHKFDGLFLKDSLLTIKVIYTNDPYDYEMQTVNDRVYDLFAIFVRKEVTFRITTTTIETKLYK